jgi:hypothetical protein
MDLAQPFQEYRLELLERGNDKSRIRCQTCVKLDVLYTTCVGDGLGFTSVGQVRAAPVALPGELELIVIESAALVDLHRFASRTEEFISARMDSGRNMTREPSLTYSMRFFETQRRIVSIERPRILAAVGTSRSGSRVSETPSRGQGRGRGLAGDGVCELTYIDTQFPAAASLDAPTFLKNL